MGLSGFYSSAAVTADRFFLKRAGIAWQPSNFHQSRLMKKMMGARWTEEKEMSP